MLCQTFSWSLHNDSLKGYVLELVIYFSVERVQLVIAPPPLINSSWGFLWFPNGGTHQSQATVFVWWRQRGEDCPSANGVPGNRWGEANVFWNPRRKVNLCEGHNFIQFSNFTQPCWAHSSPQSLDEIPLNTSAQTLWPESLLALRMA